MTSDDEFCLDVELSPTRSGTGYGEQTLDLYVSRPLEVALRALFEETSIHATADETRATETMAFYLVSVFGAFAALWGFVVQHSNQLFLNGVALAGMPIPEIDMLLRRLVPVYDVG